MPLVVWTCLCVDMEDLLLRVPENGNQILDLDRLLKKTYMVLVIRHQNSVTASIIRRKVLFFRTVIGSVAKI